MGMTTLTAMTQKSNNSDQRLSNGVPIYCMDPCAYACSLLLNQTAVPSDLIHGTAVSTKIMGRQGKAALQRWGDTCEVNAPKARLH